MYFSGFASKSKEAQCEEFMDEVRHVEIEELLENGKFQGRRRYVGRMGQLPTQVFAD